MKAKELFDVWAPEDTAWSVWARPVLFADERPHTGEASDAWRAAVERCAARQQPSSQREAALVIDLPGTDSLAFALRVAASGFRPVPLFNSCAGPSALVDNEPIRAGLELGAAALLEARLPAEAPPAFVLDANRMNGSPAPGRFDNRWMTFPQDFPSAAALLSRGLQRVVLVQDGRQDPREDLAHILLRWQSAGIEILALDVASGLEPARIHVSTPSRFGWTLYRGLAALGLRRSSIGGFGAVVPTPSPHGGAGFG